MSPRHGPIHAGHAAGAAVQIAIIQAHQGLPIRVEDDAGRDGQL
jgi:hypothetical protein